MALRGLLLCQNVLIDPKAYAFPVYNLDATNYLGKDCKNTIEFFKSKDEQTVCRSIRSYLRFESGNTAYGIFSLQSSVDTCKANYSSGRVVLKVTDPLASKSYC